MILAIDIGCSLTMAVDYGIARKEVNPGIT